MPVLRNPESDETKEMARWEMFPSMWTPGDLRPGNPYRPGNDYGKAGAAFPRMLYLARHLPNNGKWAISQDPPARYRFNGGPQGDIEWDLACQAALSFTTSCQRIVNNEDERKKARDEGWRDTPTEATEYRAALDKAIGDAAAERNYQDRNMSEKAKAEAAQVEGETFGHVPEIPEAPRRKRGRPRKNAEPAT